MTQHFPASPATLTFNANGALADTLVDDFGRAAMLGGTMPIPPRDWRLCLDVLDYQADAEVDVTLFFATGAGVAVELTVTIASYIGADATDALMWTSVIVPRDDSVSAAVPLGLRITKAAADARIVYAYRWTPPGGC